MKPTPPETLTDRLRRAIAETPLPMTTIAAVSGVERASLIRFARGDQSLRLDNADRLADFFGLILIWDPNDEEPPPARRRRSKPKRRKPAG